MLGDGSLVHATRDNEYSDLYHCLPWSHGTFACLTLTLTLTLLSRFFFSLFSQGTLGFLVALEVQIIPVKVAYCESRIKKNIELSFNSFAWINKPYVRMEYIPIRGQKEYCDKIRELSGAMDANYQVC